MIVLPLIAAITSGVIWGLVPVLYAEASKTGGSIRANFWKSLGALILLLVTSILTGNLVVPPLVGFAYILLNMSLGTGLGDYSWLKSIEIIGPGRSTPIVFTYVVWTAVLSHLMLGETLSIPIMIGAILSVSGIWLISRTGDSSRWSLKGILYSLLSSFCYTLGPIAAKLALEYVTPITMTVWNVFMVTLIYGLLAAPNFHVKGRSKVVLGGALGMGVALPLYFYAVDEIGVTIPTLATALGPPVSQIASHLSGDRLTKSDVLGSSLVVLGLILSTLS